MESLENSSKIKIFFMKKILLLGSTGMLGWQLLKSLQNLKKFKIFASYKNKKKLLLLKKNLQIKKNVSFIKFDINKSSKFNYSNYDYIINCIGVIKPFINENNQDSIKNAIKINSLFPHELIPKNTKTKVFQIATDCVFDGKKGNYFELNTHDAEDVYGKSKSLGEINAKNFFNIRCSIVGPELSGHKSLLDWFKFLPLKSKVFGFKNHSWNGVTTYAFGKVICGIIKKNLNMPNMIHLSPKDHVNKFELLSIFKKYLLRKDINLKSKNSKMKINRTIQTSDNILNKKIWKYAGYKSIPTIEYLLKEAIE